MSYVDVDGRVGASWMWVTLSLLQVCFSRVVMVVGMVGRKSICSLKDRAGKTSKRDKTLMAMANGGEKGLTLGMIED